MASQGTPRKTTTPHTHSAFTANPQQHAAIAHGDGPAAFIAAAGTGKTSILVQRLARLIAKECIAPESLLCVTFTRAAANEMEKRVVRELKAYGKQAKDLKGLRIVTFHGLGHQMLREKLQWTPLELNHRLISGDHRQWLAEDIVRPWRSNRTRGMNWDVDVVEVLNAVDKAKDALITPEHAAHFFHTDLFLDADTAAQYQEFYTKYEETKKQSKSYDLADLIYVPLLLLETQAKFRKSWQGRYQYIQVDETQDTNPSQYRLVQYLAEPHQNVVVVGDPDQAIYQFRGASPEASILSFRTMYPHGKIYHIEHNYRSTPQILDAANALIFHNGVTPGFEKTLRPTQPDGDPVLVVAYEDQIEEAEGIANQIERLIRFGIRINEPCAYKDIFVLSRTNHHLASLEIVLAQKHIPYRALGGSSFFKRKTTKDMLAYLTLIDGIRAHQEFQAVWNTPQQQQWEEVFTPMLCGEQDAAFRAVAHIPSRAYFAQTGKSSHRYPPTFYAALSASAAGRPLLLFCTDCSYAIPVQNQPTIKDFLGLLHKIWNNCHNQPAAAIKILREIAYDTHLRLRDTRHHEEQDGEEEELPPTDQSIVDGRMEELDELITIAQRHHTIRHFLQEMARLKEQAEDISKNKRDCVQLLTIHKSKGLEQKVVFVMGMTEGIFPHNRSLGLTATGSSGIHEERRLAYVAYTRAQRKLFLTTILHYRGGKAQPSRFIEEAGLMPAEIDGTVISQGIQSGSVQASQQPMIKAQSLFE